MTGLFWGLAAIFSLIGAWQAISGNIPGGIAYAVIPYCLARAVEALSRSRDVAAPVKEP